jgi:uncharacterized protein (DUF488 family)
MFYRERVLLAIIETFGGKLTSTDLEKHLFLFCQTSGRDYYDFFPYHYGPFSFTSYDDKRKLIKQDILKDDEFFQLASAGPYPYFSKLLPEDRQAMHLYVRQHRTLKGDDLLRKTYLEYPQYSVRSEIATKILSSDEYELIKKGWNNKTNRELLTLGYEGITIDRYIAKLIFNNVSLLADVRQNPYSHKHGFSQKQLENYIQKAGIKYVHLPQLGVPSNLRRNLNVPKDYESLFEYYATHILQEQDQAISAIFNWVLEGQRVALTCFEAEHSMCHRHKITDLMAKDTRCNFPITHL